MSSSLGIGVPVPKMLPITGTWTLPFAAYLALLSGRVVAHRVRTERYMGNTCTKEGSDSNDNPDPLLLDSRAHANFLETVPLTFALATIAELNGANRKILNYAMATLFVLRIAHVELGLKGKDTIGPGRPAGFFGTQGLLLGLAGWSAWLIKGYWGFD